MSDNLRHLHGEPFDPAAPLPDTEVAANGAPTWERLAVAFGLWILPLANLTLTVALLVVVLVR